jgi:hypothetical protein
MEMEIAPLKLKMKKSLDEKLWGNFVRQKKGRGERESEREIHTHIHTEREREREREREEMALLHFVNLTFFRTPKIYIMMERRYLVE